MNQPPNQGTSFLMPARILWVFLCLGCFMYPALAWLYHFQMSQQLPRQETSIFFKADPIILAIPWVLACLVVLFTLIMKKRLNLSSSGVFHREKFRHFLRLMFTLDAINALGLLIGLLCGEFLHAAGLSGLSLFFKSLLFPREFHK